jgi:hypothetical protein
MIMFISEQKHARDHHIKEMSTYASSHLSFSTWQQFLLSTKTFEAKQHGSVAHNRKATWFSCTT